MKPDVRSKQRMAKQCMDIEDDIIRSLILGLISVAIPVSCAAIVWSSGVIWG